MVEAASPEGAPDESHGRAPGPLSLLARWATTAWCLVAGAFLAVSPHAGAIWTDDFFGDVPALRNILWMTGVRWAISAFGVLLVACGAWDVARHVVDDDP